MAAGLAGVLALAGCGSDDFENKPRPPTPLSVTVEIDDNKVSVSPDEFGAGLVVFTISNQAESAQTLAIEGPRISKSSRLLEPTTTGELKLDLEPGEYELKAGADSKAKPGKLVVGPERPSAQNELLQP